jgi:hypothetical protein
VLVVTSKQITQADHARLNGFVMRILEKSEFDGARLATEIRRAMSGRHPGV